MKKNKGFTIKLPKKALQLTSNVILMAEGESISGKAVWDTGATNVMMTPRTINALHPKIVEEADTNTPEGKRVVSGYRVNIALPGNLFFENVSAYSMDFDDDDMICLIGMDIISRGTMKVTSDNEMIVFDFVVPYGP